MAENAIETDRLTKRFRRLRSYRDIAMYRWRQATHPAVEEITLEVRRGELFGLLGENGAGKTTLIKMLSTTLLPTSGRASVAGYDVVAEAQAVRRVIGLVNGDERSFYWRLTGRQNLRYFAALYHVPRHVTADRVVDLLEMLGVAEIADERFSTYSTGIRQKFAIARGLLTQPRVLFLDEPTRALDPIAAEGLRRYIADHIVGERGYTALLATHSLSEAESICDRVTIIRGGRVIASGSVHELTRSMRLAAVFEIIVSGPTLDIAKRISAVRGLPPVSVTDEGEQSKLEINIEAEDGDMNSLLRAVLDSGAHVQSCTTRLPTLDDVYRAAHTRDSAADE